MDKLRFDLRGLGSCCSSEFIGNDALNVRKKIQESSKRLLRNEGSRHGVKTKALS